jgi:hypothetical protein
MYYRASKRMRLRKNRKPRVTEKMIVGEGERKETFLLAIAEKKNLGILVMIELETAIMDELLPGGLSAELTAIVEIRRTESETAKGGTVVTETREIRNVVIKNGHRESLSIDGTVGSEIDPVVIRRWKTVVHLGSMNETDQRMHWSMGPVPEMG